MADKFLSQQALDSRKHRHHNLRTEDDARRIKSGQLDLKLLRDAGLLVNAALQPAVKVELDSLHASKTGVEPLFKVFDQTDQFLGHYFASAFKSLAT